MYTSLSNFTSSDDGTEELPLKNVIVCVAKHLSSRQVELNGVAKQLGGDFKWVYDPQVSCCFPRKSLIGLIFPLLADVFLFTT